jgi:hypothetical protein
VSFILKARVFRVSKHSSRAGTYLGQSPATLAKTRVLDPLTDRHRRLQDDEQLDGQ